MPHIIDARKEASVRGKILSIMQAYMQSDARLQQVVRDIITDVRTRGDAAVFEYTARFDRAEYDADSVRVPEHELEEAENAIEGHVYTALRNAAERIEAYHYKQMPEDTLYQDEAGITLGWRWTAIERVGLYVPGGKAVYPSSVLMNAIPARIAGCERIVMVVPTPDGEVSPVLLAAAHIAGVEEVYKVGGAQAVAALAYGTQTIPQVDKIVGPGNAYVAEAKRQVYGAVGIDMIAGPSEVVVISDKFSNPAWVAADMLSQAEHDEDARCVLITDDEKFADKVQKEVEKLLPQLAREDIARASYEKNGMIIIVEDLKQAARISNIIAPEHLELAVNSPKALERRITNAGAIFLGRYTPEAIGDYNAGPSHVLPTSGSARFSSGLSVYDFLKRSSIIGCEAASFIKLSSDAETLAENEKLGAHALSVKIRKKEQCL